jgi:hypothetical protein
MFFSAVGHEIEGLFLRKNLQVEKLIKEEKALEIHNQGMVLDSKGEV